VARRKTVEELDKIVSAVQAGDTEQALAAHGKAEFYAQVYADIANGCIPRSLDKIKGPTGVGVRSQERDPTSSTGAF